MCVGCRQRSAVNELLRVVAAHGPYGAAQQHPGGAGHHLVPDPSRQRSGRGAHVHRNRDCLDKAVSRRAFGRALRLSGPLDDTAVKNYVESHQVSHDIDGVGHTPDSRD
ncbi:YlxR family protein [Natronoglycomyces albus]|uniref:YlxR family protein n=1 Tax=Natronoglycomyces albus TaxID=2811108 RepID=A0A895XUE1_9ACTN|nr:YlxR family protein [Natronoglycomyces albus]